MTEKNEKLEKMTAIRAKLDDVDNSIKSLIAKIANVQLDLMEAPNEGLEKAIGDIQSRASANAEELKAAIHDFEIEINQLKQ